jgi:hypothetical protein
MDYVVPDAYLKQRKSRMGDAIFDYLSDDSVSARNIYEDMLSEIDIIIDYHKSFLDNAVTLKELMMGHRPADLQTLMESSLDD